MKKRRIVLLIAAICLCCLMLCGCTNLQDVLGEIFGVEKYEFGIVEGDIYTNPYFGVQFTVPENCSMLPAEELVYEEEPEADYEYSDVEAGACTDDGLAYIYFHSDNVLPSELEEYCNNTIADFESSGYQVKESNGSASFAGKNYRKIEMEIEEDGITVADDMYFYQENAMVFVIEVVYLDAEGYEGLDDVLLEGVQPYEAPEASE